VKKYKRIFALLLTVILAFVLGACGNSKNDGGSGGKQASGGEKVELKMIFWDSNQEAGLNDMAEDL